MNWDDVIREFRESQSPPPPTGLAIMLGDGRVLKNLPLMYKGINDDGLHEWEACVPGEYTVELMEHAMIHIDRLPPGTTVTMTVDLGLE